MSYSFSGASFVGKLAGEMLMPAIATGRTIESNLVKLMPNVLGKQQVIKQNSDAIFQSMSAGFNTAGSAQRSLVELAPIALSVMQDFDQTQLLTSWESVLLSGGVGAKNIQTPTDLADILKTVMERKISKQLEALFWGGKNSLGTTIFPFSESYTGIIDQAFAASGVQKATSGTLISATQISTAGLLSTTNTQGIQAGDYVTIGSVTNASTYKGSTIVGQSFKVSTVVTNTSIVLTDPDTGAAITTSAAAGASTAGFINDSNINNALISVLQLLPVAVASDPSTVVIAVPQHLFRAYKTAQSKATAYQTGTFNLRQPSQGDFTDNVLGYRLEMIPNGKPNTIMAYQRDNVIWATAMESDYNALWIKDLFPEQGIMKYGYRANFLFDGKIAFPEEVGLITPVLS